jgi:DNA-binding MarR family transcriptional regulator
MTNETNPFTEISFPGLLRAARNVYAAAIRAAMAEAGCDDLPRNGAYVIGSIARTGAPLSQIVRELAVSRQAAGQLVDTLVLRGYIERSVDLEDRRRLTVTLTERGRAGAAVVRSAVERIDVQLLERVGPEHAKGAIATLWALVNLGEEPAEKEAEE